MGAIASQFTSLTIVYSTVWPGADQRKHQSSASLAFLRGIHRWPVNSPHKGPVTRKIFPFDYVIMRHRSLLGGLLSAFSCFVVEWFRTLKWHCSKSLTKSHPILRRLHSSGHPVDAETKRPLFCKQQLFCKQIYFLVWKLCFRFHCSIGPINNKPGLVRMMAWHRTGNKPLSDKMMVHSLLTHIYGIRPRCYFRLSDANIRR